MGSALPPPILEALARGQTILTANQRAARTLRHAYNAAQRAQHQTHWNPPNIFALDTWLATLHHQLLLNGQATRLLLNPVQQHSLWRTILAADREVPGLRNLDTLAELAASAWNTLHLFNGRARLREFAFSTDTRAFQRWAEAFDRQSLRNDYLTPAQLPATLQQALADSNLDIPNPGLFLVDFDQLPPAHTQLFDDIQQAGYAVERFHTQLPVTADSLLTTPDDPSELRAAALWARDHLAANPAASIAIVVPNLADRRHQLDRVFSQILNTQPVILSEVRPASSDERSRSTPAELDSTPPSNPLHQNPLYEFSLGHPLAETPFAAAALLLLRWPTDPLPLESISTLLLSPVLTAAEALAAAEFDAFELRSANLLRPEFTLTNLIDLLHRSPRADRLTSLRNRLTALQRTAAESTGAPSRLASSNEVASQKSHAQWADTFRNLLSAAGLATDTDSLSFQTRRAWDSALDSLATLDFTGTLVSASAALRSLTRIARQSIFAPESTNAPIQILGPLEPGGTTFDALWFLSADDQSWPSPPATNPLIPWHIQRDLGIPGADPASDNAFTQTLTHRLAHTAPQVVFSYARHSEEGERRPSPLLRSLNLTDHTPPAEAPHHPLPYATFEDTQPLPELPAGITPGGARVLELQAACAFRAFAELRLSSTEPDTPDPGLDPRERGNQVHKVMQAFWSQIHSQEALKALPLADRNDLLDRCIATAITRAQRHARNPWDEAYLDVQRRRLHALLTPWLDFEATRPAFAVRQQEETHTGTIGPLTLKLRADRVDQTTDGLLILDYKTGLASPKDWTSDRPEAPQLPLYAVLEHQQSSDDPVAGVAFALLRAGDGMKLTGYATSTEVLPKLASMDAPSLESQIEEWQRILTNLAIAFSTEDPIANPKTYPKTCERCSQRILCRLDPATLNDFADDELEESNA